MFKKKNLPDRCSVLLLQLQQPLWPPWLLVFHLSLQIRLPVQIRPSARRARVLLASLDIQASFFQRHPSDPSPMSSKQKWNGSSSIKARAQVTWSHMCWMSGPVFLSCPSTNICPAYILSAPYSPAWSTRIMRSSIAFLSSTSWAVDACRKRRPLLDKISGLLESPNIVLDPVYRQWSYRLEKWCSSIRQS